MSSLVALIPLAVFLATATLVFAVYRLLVQRREMVRARLAHYGLDIGVASFPALSSGLLRERRLSSIRGLDSLLANRGFSEKIASELSRAAIPLRVGEYLLIRWLAALGLFVIASLFAKTIIAGILLGMVGYFIPRLYVRRCEQGRINKFDGQLVDAITLMANSLRAGFGLLQGLEAVSREMPAPISEEFQRVIQDISIGATAEEALVGITERVRSEDLDLVVTAMLVQRTVGGNLAEILTNIAHTIRERVRLLRDVRVRTTQERLSAYIIGALPIGLLILISIENSSYTEMLFTTTVGHIMLGAAALLEGVGFYMARRFMTIEV